MSIQEIIRNGRSGIIEGIFCDLIPLEYKDLPSVVELRNQEKNKYCLNQADDITLEQQEIWFEEYEKRDNDIYWGVWDKNHNIMLGTLRLYDIQPDICEEGSCIINEKYAMDAPYATEAKYLVGVFAFDTLGVKQLINEIRTDNKVMASLAKRQGYKKHRQVEIRGVAFDYYLLDKEDFKRDRLEKVLDYWKERQNF